MKSAIRAWALFLVGLSIPSLLVGWLAYQAGWDHYADQYSRSHSARITAAAEVRSQVERTLAVAKEGLLSIREDATEAELAAALRALAPSQPFAVGFYAIDERVTIVDGYAEADVPRLEAEMANEGFLRLMRDQKMPPYSKEPIGYAVSRDRQLSARRLENGNRVGFVTTSNTVVHGSRSLIPDAWELEVVSGKVWDDFSQQFRSQGDKLKSFIGEGPFPMRPMATRELLTSFTVGTAHFHLRVKDPDAFEALAKRQRLEIQGLGMACVALFFGLSAGLFYRSRRAQHLANLRTDFVAAVSHELRTPLASVRMFAELLEAGDVPNDERPEVEAALAGETRRLHATLDRMLRFGALARGKLVIERSLQPVRPIAVAAARSRKVTLDIDPQLESTVDAGMLELAIDNLLSNAVKYAPEGGPYVVRARNEGASLVLEVIDRGPGLSKKAQKKIFLPFERVDHRLSQATEGSGVGLALVRGIAQAHGGEATVTSELGQGATFTLRLPRA